MSSSSSYANGILSTSFNNAKRFIFDNQYITASYTNGTGSSVTLPAGRIMGLIFSTNKVTPRLTSGVTNGSQVPYGILASDYTVANGATVTVTLCISGQVDASLISDVADPADLTATVSLTDSGSATVVIGTIESIMVSKGLIPITVTENTYLDN